MTQSISGLGSGLDTASIIEQLVSIEKSSLNIITARKTTAQTKLAAYSGIREQLTKLRAASLAVARSASWKTLTATSSNTSVATVSAGSGSFGGAISFTVNSLARAGSVRSNSTITGTSAAVNADAAILVAAGGQRYGFASLSSDNALSIGSHEIEITQASAAASKSGDSALSASTVITGANNTLNINVNGAAKVLTIADGTYTRDQLAAALKSAADAAGAAVTVTVDGTTNALQVTTTREGSAASLQVMGGSAMTALLLTTDGAPVVGTDGKVQTDDGVVQSFSNIEVGSSLVLNSTAGTITATMAGGLRVGVLNAKNVSVGDGSLATVVANINAASAGVTASAVLVGANTYRLQITSNTAGALNGANVSDAEFSGIGGFVDLNVASDAQVTVGDGPGAYTVASETNTVAGMLPGVTVTLKAESDEPITITASRDVSALTDNIKALVDEANSTKKALDLLTKYDPEAKQGSILTGDAAARRVISDLSRAITSAVPFANPGAPGLAGVSINRDGQYEFDAAKFTEKFNADPEGVTRMFVQGGSATDGSVTFVSAGDRARAGTYAIEVSALATKASTVGLQGAWPTGTPTTIKVAIGAKEITYNLSGTETQSEVVTALNTKFSSAGLALAASVSGTGIAIESAGYGSTASFQVAWDGTTYNTYTGTNVAGTIGGVTATGVGQQLSVAFDNPQLGGIALTITGGATGSRGTFEYQPGIGQRVVTNLLDATDVVTGYITSAEKSLKSRMGFIDQQIASMNNRISLFEQRIKRQFATLDSVMGTLKAQGEWLTGQIANLNGGK